MAQLKMRLATAVAERAETDYGKNMKSVLYRQRALQASGSHFPQFARGIEQQTAPAHNCDMREWTIK
jgi:hypothetical protein